MPVLRTDLRNKLARVISEARDVAEAGAKATLESLAVHEAKPYSHMSEAQRDLRNRLRALGRQIGDPRNPDKGTQAITHLVQACAYEHWHRMLFARFLAENDLLIHPDMQVPVTLKECEELAKDEGTDLWTLAGRYAQRMLPQVFRADHPAFELAFAREHQTKLERLLEGLETEVFTARDSLGWVYQFWQAKQKERVNQSEVKIGADELPAVTQLFTEHYMVMFLLDNSLGAWWAARRLREQDWQTAQSEDELRHKAAIAGVPLECLRFVRVPSPPGGEGQGEGEIWQPAAGTYDQWPDNLTEFKLLDPCCGSGHFLVAAFHMLVPMRRELEGLSEQEAVDAVLRDNLHGLEIDQRCVEIAAFALALEAWRYPDAGGYRPLPRFNIACCGQSVSASSKEWMELAGGDNRLEAGIKALYDIFSEAPLLGSLIDPARSVPEDLLTAGFPELESLLECALHKYSGEEDKKETVIAALGFAGAARLLTRKYHLVTTNVPYLLRRKQHPRLLNFLRNNFPDAANDLGISFADRIQAYLHAGAASALVLPQSFIELRSYKNLRQRLLKSCTWKFIARLGPGAFETISGEVVNVCLQVIENTLPYSSHMIPIVDVNDIAAVDTKRALLQKGVIESVEQRKITNSTGPGFSFITDDKVPALSDVATASWGISPADLPRFGRCFWETLTVDDPWCYWQSSFQSTTLYSGRHLLINMGPDLQDAIDSGNALIRGQQYWNQSAVISAVMGKIPCTLGTGEAVDTNVATIVPFDRSLLPALWAYCESGEFSENVRKLYGGLKVTSGTLLQVPFDVHRWKSVASEKYSNSLPEPYSNDPTQWIFHGHPCGSVVWSEESKQLEHGPLRTDNTVLQVAVARLLGYRWPAELDEEMELSEESRYWIAEAQKLNEYTDNDGIVCLPAIRGELQAHQRLLRLLEAAYGNKWNAGVLNQLLKTVDCGGKTLNAWLRDKFFEQHCALFHQRPFIWHIWDGLKDGFSALVNYHQLDRANLERLIYTYLGDWISIQEAGARNREDGAEERLAAAKALKQKLEAIMEGEDPLDIFVRWKPIEQQPIGWEPDLNDGVRLNIRPFMLADDVRNMGAGVLRTKPKINWKKDRGKDVSSAPWFDTFKGERINDHHLSLEEKRTARERNQKVTA